MAPSGSPAARSSPAARMTGAVRLPCPPPLAACMPPLSPRFCADRMYYTGIGEGSRHPDAQGYILSAVSTDAKSWFKEEGVRVDVDIHTLGSLRVLCPDVLQLEDGRWRMYFEARAPNAPCVILSAISDDGLSFVLEVSCPCCPRVHLSISTRE